jgi:hypothetical protein
MSETQEAQIEKLTLIDCLSYRDILDILQKVSESSELLTLPDDLHRTIAEYLVVQPICTPEVMVVGASSDRGDFPLERILIDDNQTWWMSESGSMPHGRGEVYVEFCVSKNGQLRRLQSISISIPPLPFGPLSVRKFRVDHSTDAGLNNWHVGEEIMSLSGNRYGMQRFDLKPMDAVRVRLVCLSNQVSVYDDNADLGSHGCVGLYAVYWA